MYYFSCIRYMLNVYFLFVVRGCYVGQYRFSILCRGRKGFWVALFDECVGAGASCIVLGGG